ncbi:hypothetical protein [Algicola sagamiensis]|uniref:hypothetical protein n=1 Tax=Algicola sagamiensis TaxID=163869 RepID=UPI00037992A5|nr:hypothetical protein [Algicola sagamiensis]
MSSEEIDFGKHWAAIEDGKVLSTIPMFVPKDKEIDFDEFRDKAIACLSMLGDVKSGVIVEVGGLRYFRQRLTHENRGKSPRKQKEFLLYHPNLKRRSSDG